MNTVLHNNAILFYLASILLLSVFVFISTTTAQAQEQPPLQPTQITADIPEEYNKLFKLQWGGGSLYQLKARLATMNCIANTIWMHNNNQWHPYNQYEVPSDLTQEFRQTYQEFIPAGELWADCFDICEFEYYDAPRNGGCSSLETMRANNFYNALPYPIDDDSLCTTNFDPRVQASVLPSMPLYPDVCIIRQEAKIRGSAMVPFAPVSNAIYPVFDSFIAVYEASDVDEQGKVRLFNTEIHELCHSNQYWHFVENLQPDNIRTVASTASAIWLTTQAGQEFVASVGFQQDKNRDWTLPDNTYEGIYAINPIELAAELCTMYFIDKMEEQSKYNFRVYNKDTGRYKIIEPRDLDPNQYLTPQIRQWIETYIILPDITE